MRRIFIILLSACVLAGCASQKKDAAVPAYEAMEEGQAQAAGKSQTDDSRGKNLTGEKAGLLTEAQKAIMAAYMDRYYESVSSLQIKDLSNLFLDSSNIQKAFNRNAWEYLIELRAMQNTDLRLEGYTYELEVDEVLKREDGSVRVELTETSVQNFAAYPDVDSVLFDVRHIFVLELQCKEWRIGNHWQQDGIYQNLLGEYWGQALTEIPEAEHFFEDQRAELIKQAKEQKKIREKPGMRMEQPAV